MVTNTISVIISYKLFLLNIPHERA